MFAFQGDRKQGRIYSCKLSKVTTLRGGLGISLPATIFWLEQKIHSLGSTEGGFSGRHEGGPGLSQGCGLEWLETTLVFIQIS